MREIRISVKRQWEEMKWFAFSFLAAFLLNVVSIIVYGTSWTELWTQILWVLALTLFIYVVCVVVRIICSIVRRLAGKT